MLDVETGTLTWTSRKLAQPDAAWLALPNVAIVQAWGLCFRLPAYHEWYVACSSTRGLGLVPPMRIVRRCAALLGVLAGCYNPSLREGAPCETSEQCPTSQHCVLGSCSLHDAPAVDASLPEPPDAPGDAPSDAAAPPIDAMRLACSTTGLTCSGTATMFTCGGNCWVLCTGGAPRDTARAACAGWMGALGEIDDAMEQSCVAARVNAVAWLGLIQSATATTPDAGWTWNGTTPLGFTNWQSGVPDDRDNTENGAEQCAKLQTDGTWDDVTCSSSIDFLCERP